MKAVLQNSIIDGPQLISLKEKLSEQYNCTDIFLTGSGRLAISLFLKALKREGIRSYNVLLPFYICPSVPDAIANTGFTPVFVPVGKDLTMDPLQISHEDIQTASVAIIPHIYGFPTKIQEIISILKSINPNIFILDDAASAYSVSIDDKKLGTFGDAGILSFCQGKLLNATGGGALFTTNRTLLSNMEKEYKLLPELSPKNKTRDLLKVLWRFGYHKYADPISYLVGKILPIRNITYGNMCKMSNLDASIIVSSMTTVPSIHKSRGTIIARYHERLENCKNFFFPQFIPDGNPPVSRFYIGYKNTKLILDEDGNIKKHNPLYLFARKLGVKVFYPYLPVHRFMPKYGKEWNKEQWILSLLGLPIDYKRSLTWHDKIIDIILLYDQTQQDKS